VSVETAVESVLGVMSGAKAGIQLRMLGPLTVVEDGIKQALPASRKVRALLAYLALAPRPVGRSRLCELLWDVPNDPRGELRWCLSKIRNLLGGGEKIVTSGDQISIDLTGCFVDVFELSQAAERRFEALDVKRLRGLAELCVGDFLEGTEVDRSPQFEGWLTAQRRRFRSLHVAVLEHLAKILPLETDDLLPHLEKWIELSPFDARAHANLLTALEQRGQRAACEEHLVAAARSFATEDIDFTVVSDAWRVIKDRRGVPTRSATTAVASAKSLSKVDAFKVDVSSPRRASLAVMPFAEQTSWRGGLADGLTHDIITRLAKLRSLFVIAQGTVFALADRRIGPEDAGRRLNVDYFASGAVRRSKDRISVSVELVETRTSRIVWTEVFDHKLDDAFRVLDEIGDRIVSSIAAEIETIERNQAILKPPNSLNAWEAYHRGLWHMYRFTKAENEQAQNYFLMALRLDPTFSRAHAGVSFTHWQNAFQQWSNREKECDRAFEAAGQSLIVDDHDPAAHWAMGRALWLRGRQDDALTELNRAVDLSPNFALGHYSLSFVHSQSGDPQMAIGSADQSLRLSPFDPLLFGVLGARAFAHVRLGQFEQAAEWALKAAGRPNAHAHILAIAAHCLALAGRVSEGQAFVASIHKSLPGYRTNDFLATFRFTPDAAALFRKSGERIGLD
jgi:DNA-binding SARP family transcriptional activator